MSQFQSRLSLLTAVYKGAAAGFGIVAVLVVLEMASVDAGLSSQDAPGVISMLLYPGVWLVLAALGWEADFSGVSVALGLLVDIILSSVIATIVVSLHWGGKWTRDSDQP